jgi:hypothetical protein
MSRHLADIALGGLSVQIPAARLAPELKSSALVWGNLAFAAVLDHDGYGDIALEEVTRIAAWLKRPETEEPATKVELPQSERGRGPDDLRRLDRLNARLARQDLGEKKREAAIAERQKLEAAPVDASDERWRQQATAETVALARSRGETVDAPKGGRVRVVDRDPLLALIRAGHLTAQQYDAGVSMRDAYDARSEGVGSQLGAVNSTGGAHNNDSFVLSGLHRAKALQRIGTVERAILLSPLFGEAKSNANVGLQMLRAVCGEGKSLSSQGEGRAFARNALALAVALDIAGGMR